MIIVSVEGLTSKVNPSPGRPVALVGMLG
jgi:hypothetical protein